MPKGRPELPLDFEPGVEREFICNGVAQMGKMMYNYSSTNLIKSSRALERTCYPFSTRVRGTDTMSDHTPVPHFPENLNDYAPWVAAHGLLAPYGMCQCRCGQEAGIARRDDLRNGYYKGMPMRFIRGHGRRNYYLSLEDAFRRNVVIGASDECWEWLGVLDCDGYGEVHFRGRKYRSHRLSYTIYHGEIERGMNVCHSCDNPPCVNPNHLWVGSTLENNRDAISKGRRNYARGEQSGSVKLNESKVREIRALLSQGVGCVEISRRFGVTHATIRFISMGVTWKHVR